MISYRDAERAGLWSTDARERLRVARSLSAPDVLSIQRDVAGGCPVNPWPYGMPTVINPLVLVLGPSPGNSPLADDREILVRPPYEFPTFGEPHPKIFYRDARKFFEKIRTLFSGLIGQLYGLNEHDALSLSGLMNLDTGRYGDSSSIQFDPKQTAWVLKTVIEKLRPKFLICLGLSTRFNEFFPLISPDLDPRRPIRILPFTAYKARSLVYKEWIVARPDGEDLRLILWPQHPSRSPFTNRELWAQSVDEYASSQL